MGTKLSLKLNLTIRKEVTILASAKRSSGTAHLEVTVDMQESTQEKKHHQNSTAQKWPLFYTDNL